MVCICWKYNAHTSVKSLIDQLCQFESPRKLADVVSYGLKSHNSQAFCYWQKWNKPGAELGKLREWNHRKLESKCWWSFSTLISWFDLSQGSVSDSWLHSRLDSDWVLFVPSYRPFNYWPRFRFHVEQWILVALTKAL